MARRRTARAAAGSPGGPKTPGPASCIAPNPVRLTMWGPRRAVCGMVIGLSRGAAWMRPLSARPAAVAVGRVRRCAARAEGGAGLMLVESPRPGYVEVAAHEDGAAWQGSHLCRRRRLLACGHRDRVGAQRPRRAACHDAHHVLRISAV